MVFLAVLSGLINLSSQTVFQKVVSMTVGDLYTTFLTVTLTFILGSAIGSYYGHRIRRFLPLIELGAGIYSLAIFLLLQGPFYKTNLPLILVIIGLLPPALSLGTHIPLYSYYLRKVRFGLVYCLYHFGAVFGLIAFEWYYVQAGSAKLSVFLIGAMQVSLGLTLLIFKNKGRFKIEKDQKSFSLLSFFKEFPISVLTVMTASTLGFYVVIWALKTQTIVTEAFRLQATLVSCAVFFWMSLAGVASKRLQLRSEYLFIIMMVMVFSIYQSFGSYSLWLTDQFSGELPNYFVLSFALAAILTAPVFISSLIFVNETNVAAKKLEIDVASGSLNLIASFGNILGFIFGSLMAAHFWDQKYFAVFITASAVAAILLSYGHKHYRGTLAGALGTSLLGIFLLNQNFKDGLFINRVRREERPHYRVSEVEVHSHILSSIAFFKLTSDYPDDVPMRIYMVDGHFSHDFLSSAEFISGLASAKLSTKPHDKSLVIGIGSGQAAWGVNAISHHTDMVEVSPIVLKNLDLLKKDNFDLIHNPRIKIHLADGFNFLRNCEPHSYDLILNTATYPSNFNAAKLYSEEMLDLASQCLREDGIFQTYFDHKTVGTPDDFDEFLAPIMKHFKYVDIMAEPYPQVLASNSPKKVKPFSASDFVDQNEYQQFIKAHRQDFELECRPFLRNIEKPESAPQMSTLDRPYLERNSIMNSVKALGPNYILSQFLEFYKAPYGKEAIKPCE